nr:hypothetical protein [uncultured Cohaesibacter sp.]
MANATPATGKSKEVAKTAKEEVSDVDITTKGTKDLGNGTKIVNH